MDESTARPISWLSRWEKCGLGLLLAVVVLFGVLVEVRSVFLTRRMGDLNVYLRAAWAVRVGDDLYSITEHNGWHYNYPPLLAIFLVPLADAPEGADRTCLLPYGVSVAIWYLFNVLLVALSVHWLARAIEDTSPDPEVRWQPAGCRRWWALRILPVLACITPIGHTLMRGQVNLVVLAFLCATAAALLRRQSWRAGFWLGGAACIKIIPLFLVIYPLWKRDLRCLAGCALGLVVGLGLIPMAVFGPAQTLEHYRTFREVMVLPALTGTGDESRARELLGAEAVFSQSLVSTLHNVLHPDPSARPRFHSLELKAVAWLIGAVLTGLTLLRARRLGNASGPPLLLVLGALAMLMLLLSPVCHRHYFCLALPLVMGLLALTWERRGSPWLDGGLLLVLLVNLAATSISHLPRWEWLRDWGPGMLAALLLWLTALVRLSPCPRPERSSANCETTVPALSA